MPFDTLRSDDSGLNEVVMLAGNLRQRIPRLRRDLVVARLRQKRLERVGFSVSHGHIAGINRHTGGPEDPVEVGGEEGGAVGGGGVEVEQGSMEPGRMEDRRVGVGDRLLLVWIPCAEVRNRAEDRTRGLQFKGVFRRGEAAFAR